jgi:Ni/Co efflux regulator RcnB
MKRLITSALAIALIAGPLAATSADAQTSRHQLKKSAAAARAQVPPRAPFAQAAPESNAVYEWGKYQGQDPDPNVRLMLRRDVHN